MGRLFTFRRLLRPLTAGVTAVSVVAGGSLAITAPASAATQDNAVVEVNNDDATWAEQAYECFDTGANLTPQQKSVAGPQRAPYGSGSHHIQINEYSSQTELYRTDTYDGLPLAELSRLQYSTHADAFGEDAPDRQPTYLRLNVDNDGDQVRDASLFFFPANNGEQQPVVNGEWQNWDVANGDLSVNGDNGPNDTVTLDEYVATHPDATVVNNADGGPLGGGLALVTGCGMGGDSDPQRKGNYYVDRVVVGDDDADTLYDFEGRAESEGDIDEQTVDPDHRAPWVSQAYDYVTGRDLTSNQTFVSGPGEAPNGAGSLRFTMSDDSNPNRVEQYRTEAYDYRLLRDVRDLSFSTYARATGGNTVAQQPPYLYLRVDNDADGEPDGVLFFYPANNADQQPVENGTWQTWNAAEGRWNLNGDDGPANSFTLDQYLAEHPDAVITNNGDPDSSWSGGGMTFQVGGSGDNQNNGEYFVDDVTVTTADEETSSVVSGTRYDLEPSPPPPPAPRLSIGGASVTEGDSGTSDATFTVSMDQATDRAVTVDYATSDGSATAGADYQESNGTATIPAGETQTTVNVPVNGDTVDEPDESFTTTLSNPQNAAIDDGSGEGTITDDDDPPATSNSISIDDAGVNEGNSGTKAATFTITMEEPQSSRTTVDFATRDGAATAPADFTAKSGTAVIPAGQTETTVSVDVKGEMAYESDEDFSVRLSNPQGSGNPEIQDGTGAGTIRNNDTEVNLAARNARGDHVRAVVGTNPNAADRPVTVYRRVRGEDPVLYRGRLNDNGHLGQRLSQEFRRGSTVKLVAKVATGHGTYWSNVDRVTVDRR